MRRSMFIFAASRCGEADELAAEDGAEARRPPLLLPVLLLDIWGGWVTASSSTEGRPLTRSEGRRTGAVAIVADVLGTMVLQLRGYLESAHAESRYI